MTQSSITIETSVYERTKHMAERKGMSVSDYVNALLKKNVDDMSPKSHTMNYFGALKDESFDMPDGRPRSRN